MVLRDASASKNSLENIVSSIDRKSRSRIFSQYQKVSSIESSISGIVDTEKMGFFVFFRTDVLVKREGAFERSKYDEVEEIEFFKGAENSLVMEQTYTHKFQCVFRLEKYPFDAQVYFSKSSLELIFFFRNAQSIWRLLV